MSLILRETLGIGERLLKEAGIADSEHDAKELYMYQSGLDRVGLMMHWTDMLPDNAVERYMELVERRASHTPLQHITGTQEFMGLKFQVDENVLIPRQDTEVLVEKVLENSEKGGQKVLDICTGSGAIAVSLAKLGKKLSLTATDLSKEALKVAEKNAKENDVKISFVECDMFEGLKGAFGPKKFDMIVSNPPYITNEEIQTLEPEVKDHEPMMALSGGNDGLDFYRIIAEKSPDHLKKDGMLFLEIGYDQGKTVPALLEANFTDIQVIQDLSGLDRVVIAKVKEKEK